MILPTLLTLSLLGAAPPALGQAAQALDDLQYEGALKVLPAEGDIKGYTHDELTTYFATRALAQLGLKKDTEAAESFRRLFTVAPDWKLPDQYGPKVVTFVSSLRAEADERGTPAIAFEGGLIKATVDKSGLAQQLELSWRVPGGKATTLQVPLVAQQPPPWPRDQKVEVWGRILGLNGSTITTWGSEPAPLRIEPPPALGGEVKPGKPLGALAFAGLGAAVAGLVAGGVGAGFALGSQDAQKAAASVTRDAEGRITNLTQRDAFALDARAKNDAGAATALFISGGVLVAAGVGLFVYDRVSVTPTPSGALLTIPLDAHFALARGEAQR